jgi:hypothetical protein
MRRLVFMMVVLLQGFLVAGSAGAAERVALIFGNSDYQNAPRLPNPGNDATDVAAAFSRLGFSVTLIRNGTFDAMRRGLLNFAQQTPSADIAVVYFAGHGMEIRDENWLIPVDAELRMDFSASQEAVSLGSILPIASRARKLGLIILDACRDNPFSKQLQMSQPGRALPARGFVAVEPPGSVLVVFAAKHGTTADDGSGRNSPFTAALLHNLETPGLEINYLFRKIHDEVYSATRQQQEPYVYGTLSSEPIYLKPAEVSRSPAEVALAWSAVKDTQDPVELETFLKQFGDNDFYAALARNRLSQLRSRPASPAPPATAAAPAPPATAAAPAQPATPDALAQPATRAEPNARVATAPNPPPNDPATADNGILGHWTWRSQCPIFGSFHGDMTLTQSDNKLAGVNTDAGEGNRRQMFDVRFNSDTISFRIKVPSGSTQRWTGNLSRRRNGQYQLQGDINDSRFSMGSCSWVATKG